jgi:hypothetical protein
MKLKPLFIYIAITTLTLAGCSSYMGDTATVTVRTGDIPLAFGQGPTGLIDRVLSALSPAKPAYADPPGRQTGVNYITLTVTGDGMADIESEIPLSTGELTLDVPVGSARTFEVNAYYSDPLYGLYLYYSGKATADLAAGDDITLPIAMVQEISL